MSRARVLVLSLCLATIRGFSPLPTAAQATATARPRSESAGPSARDVVRMVLAASRSLGLERTRALARRARLAGLMPQLRLSAERGLQQDLSSSSGSSSERLNEAVGDDLSLGLVLTFELDRLVFAAEEVRLLSIERWLLADQHKLVGEVVRLYYQRRRLQRELASAPTPDPELVDAIAEIEALLDEFTAGAFVRALEASRRGPQR